ncbi:MAG TPA: DUF4132 domain-containing protein [Verrucomicrobiota bacterium]|nr:hypothetical protein [Verrucomicrobiales bacterium]HRI12297.1 DUF4132 domain-containing protein [Verrucomicrobiota bacterium]
MPIADGFKPTSDDPLLKEHRTLEQLFKEYGDGYLPSFSDLKVERKKAGRVILGADREMQGRYVATLVARLIPLEQRITEFRARHDFDVNIHLEEGWDKLRDPHSILIELLRLLLKRKLPLSEETLAALVKWLGSVQGLSHLWYPIYGTLQNLEHHLAGRPPAPELTAAIRELANKIKQDIDEKDGHKFISQLQKLLGTLPKIPLLPGEAWSDAAIVDLRAMTRQAQADWLQLLAHCQKTSGSTPSEPWRKRADEILERLSWPRFKREVLVWFPLVDKPRTQRIEEWYQGLQPDPNLLLIEPHAEILKGLVWICGLREDAEVARALTALALSAYRKIPLKGPREVKIGNACVAALGMMPGMEGVGQLALLKVKVKFGTAQKVIEKALEVTAKRVGLPREDLEEMEVPAYGLTGVGIREEPLGESTARLTVEGDGSTELTWIKADGKPQKSVPASVKADHAEELKELQAAAKDIQKMLPAQRERIDGLFLAQKTWPLAVWRERYLDHPLVGVIARRLIWEFTTDEKTTTGMFRPHDGREEQGPANSEFRIPTSELADLDLRPVPLNDATIVRLWHPIGKEVEEVIAWREWLESQKIQQAFKQAHREVYVLTDAERNTQVYSNRFAAHILRQHQFNALCAARGWKNKLRLMVDAEFPPASRLLSQWNLRAEFWIEGIGDNYGTDTNESAVFLRVATDQVRFYQLGTRNAEVGTDNGPLPLDQIPPLVFSEIMRDVDLFVGVASVGNDPTWNDGGPDGRFRDYWQGYAFGDLSATAQTRKAILERLVPRLKIADRCSFADKFLVVRGQLRSYKIHLGSGNILMTPNDQYLCIVPKQSVPAGDNKVFLPFEGDGLLAVILSKAFLLAADDQISDTSIVSQLKR